jgi:hypothetical protein
MGRARQLLAPSVGVRTRRTSADGRSLSDGRSLFDGKVLFGEDLLAVVGSVNMHEDDAAAWADFNSGAHRDIQDALRRSSLDSLSSDWRESCVYVPGVEEGDDDIELHLGQLVDALDHAINQNHLPAPATVYRGTEIHYLREVAGAVSAEDLRGRTLVEAGFLSTSTSKDIADFWGGGAGGALMELRLPAGMPVLSLPGVGYIEQSELLLPRGCSMTITSVEAAGDLWRVRAEVLPPVEH